MNRIKPRQFFGHVLRFANRFKDKEMGVMLVSDLLRAVGDDVFEAPEFAEWASAIGDIMLYE